MPGPLSGLKIIEMNGLGPCPLAGQLLADQGAEVIVIDRASTKADPTDVNRRGKRSVALNLKSEAGKQAAHRLIASADILIEGFRPGVMEKLGLGPDAFQTDNPGLIYGRMTGWGQSGPLSQTAGHDINYLSLSGAMHAIGTAEQPVPPLNLAADYGGGTMFLIFGILSALYERGQSGKGQVVDAAMVDCVPAMMGLLHSFLARGWWNETRGDNILDGAAPFYRCYETADGKFISAGPIEPQFFAIMVEKAGLPADDLKRQNNKADWADMSASYAAIFRQKTRDEWVEIFDGTDACIAPVLTFSEAETHPHNQARGIFTRVGDIMQAAPAPRFDRTAPDAPQPPHAPGADSADVLAEAGLTQDEIAAMRENGDLT